MQREIKRRAQIYGMAAVLTAIVLGTLCYNFAAVPTETQTAVEPSPRPSPKFLKTFSSHEELRSFLTKTQGAFPFYWDTALRWGETLPVPAPAPTTPEPKAGGDYSITNVQVVGVDEADVVKTDGEYIYVIANRSILILKAYPPEEAELNSKITFGDNVYPYGIFVSADGSKIAVLGSKYALPPVRYFYAYFYTDVKTFVYVYDVSNKANPTLKRNFTMSGGYFNSRMIGDYVYAVISQPAYVIYDTVILPKIYYEKGLKEIDPSKIYYANATDEYYAYTSVVAVNMANDNEEPETLTIMMGGTSNLYVSTNNIYITFHEFDGQTSIYKVKIDGKNMTPEAKGIVPGHELNQFSMDEYNNYFRIATTTWKDEKTQNNIYVLDMDLRIVGSLTDIAPDEVIDSARFIGGRCYLTTSVMRKDPFFVIDVQDPTAPKILGYLKIPGFTRYLHPYDEDHLIGIGINENNAVKISIFDVGNVSSPTEIDKYTVPGDWSTTLVLEDHKAFLFSKEKELLVIPVAITHYDRGSTWQGAYVFRIASSYSLTLRGTITHQEVGADQWDSTYWVKRALYIEKTLYTVSEKGVKMNSLEDLSLIKQIVFP
ncbi:MAG: beta-propeller domain-containing protein [Nitrososphaerota archaeon]|nr:beta-propeller domain-containing protein [Candidatus Bathyarchaeota archaeon]MDW8022466.1 beta-propeller domain-containing protein [Nitrososphaerota archaeon]